MKKERDISPETNQSQIPEFQIPELDVIFPGRQGRRVKPATMEARRRLVKEADRSGVLGTLPSRLRFVLEARYLNEGTPPTHENLADTLGFRSKQAAQRLDKMGLEQLVSPKAPRSLKKEVAEENLRAKIIFLYQTRNLPPSAISWRIKRSRKEVIQVLSEGGVHIRQVGRPKKQKI